MEAAAAAVPAASGSTKNAGVGRSAGRCHLVWCVRTEADYLALAEVGS